MNAEELIKEAEKWADGNLIHLTTLKEIVRKSKEERR